MNLNKIGSIILSQTKSNYLRIEMQTWIFFHSNRIIIQISILIECFIMRKISMKLKIN